MADRPSASPEKTPHPAGQRKAAPVSGRRRTLLIVGAAAAVVILGLALGLGLGLGLRHHHNSSSTSASGTPTSTTTPTASSLPNAGNGTRTLEDWQLDTSQYVLDTKWDLNAPPQTRHYDFVISEGQGWPDGVVRDMLFINGKFPGPIIEVNIGDRIVVNVTNQLSTNSTSVHWHGLYQNGTNWYDGTTGVTQCGIPAGSWFVYNFTVENQYGTYWYHSHQGTQYLDGIIGPLIIHSPEEASVRGALYDEDRVVLIQDWYHDFSTVNLANYLVPDNENTEPLPDNGLVNGAAYFNCSLYGADSPFVCHDNSTYTVLSLTPGARTRLRLINTGAFAEFEVSADNHTLSVIEADGTPVAPHAVHRVPIHVAQRYSVVIAANQSASTNYWLRGNMITFCFTGTNPVLDPSTRAVISYAAEGGNATALAPVEGMSVDWADAVEVECTDLEAADLVPAVEKRPPPATKFWRVDFSFAIGAYQMDYAQVNGTTWAPLSNTSTLIEAADGLNDAAKVGTFDVEGQVGAFESNQFVVGVGNGSVEVVDLLVYSLDEGAHPFHLHGHSFWILQTGEGPFNWTHYYAELQPSGPSTTSALRRDTLTIKAYAWAVIRFVADNPGLWAFHCHIAWHMEAGLLMQFMSRADVIREMGVPDDVRGLCAQTAGNVGR